MALKRDKLDAVISDLVRERADWTCECCGLEFPDRKGRGLQASHYFGRANKSVRWHGDNVFAHCTACHFRLGSSPHEFSTWARGTLGETRYDDLVLRAKAPKKYTKADKEEMVAHYRAQLKAIRRRRAEKGEIGYIDFVNWD